MKNSIFFMLLLSVVFSGCTTVTYKDDPEDYIQTTRETAELGTGDCEDMALVRYWRAIDQGKDAKLLHLTRKSNPFNKASHVLTVIDGTYGLNRHVQMTILIVDRNVVTSNFALVQPSINGDSVAVLRELVKVIGGKPPTLAEVLVLLRINWSVRSKNILMKTTK